MKDSIRKAFLLEKRLLRIALFSCVVVIPIFFYSIYLFSKYDFKDEVFEYDTLGNINAIFFILSFASLGLLFFTHNSYRKFKRYFVEKDDFLLEWNYAGGDELTISQCGMVQYLNNPPKIITKAEIEKVSWDMDNIKDFTESVLKSNSPLGSLIPTIHLTTHSNRIEHFILFSRWEEITVIFLDLKEQGFLIFNLSSQLFKRKIRIQFPVPENITFNKSLFTDLIVKLNSKRDVDFFYFDDASIKSLDSFDKKPD